MKFFVPVILIAVLGFAAGLYLPWWSIAFAAFFVAVTIVHKPAAAFLSGLLGGFLLWACMSFWISAANDHLFAHKLSMLFIKVDNPALLIMFTGLIGGLTAGLGSLTGSLLRRMISSG